MALALSRRVGESLIFVDGDSTFRIEVDFLSKRGHQLRAGVSHIEGTKKRSFNRARDEVIKLGHGVKVYVHQIVMGGSHARVKFAIMAPDHVRVYRDEIYQEHQQHGH